MKKLLMFLAVCTVANAGWMSKKFNNHTDETATLLVVVKDPEGSRTFQIRSHDSQYVLVKLNKKKSTYEVLQSVYVTAPGNRVVILDVEGGNKIVNPIGLTLTEAIDGYDITKI